MKKYFTLITYILLMIGITSCNKNDFQLKFKIEPDFEDSQKSVKEELEKLIGSLSHADKVIIYELDGKIDALDPKKGFHLKPYGDMYSTIINKRVCTVTETTEISKLWMNLEYGPKVEHQCHYPTYGFEFYEGKKLLFYTSVCFACQNFQTPDDFMTFNAKNKDSINLVNKMMKYFPSSKLTLEQVKSWKHKGNTDIQFNDPKRTNN